MEKSADALERRCPSAFPRYAGRMREKRGVKLGLLLGRLRRKRTLAPNLNDGFLALRAVVVRLPGMMDHVAAGLHRYGAVGIELRAATDPPGARDHDEEAIGRMRVRPAHVAGQPFHSHHIGSRLGRIAEQQRGLARALRILDPLHLIRRHDLDCLRIHARAADGRHDERTAQEQQNLLLSHRSFPLLTRPQTSIQPSRYFTARPAINTRSPSSLQLSSEPRFDTWSECSVRLPRRSHQYGVSAQWIEPVPGSSSMPADGAKNRTTQSERSPGAVAITVSPSLRSAPKSGASARTSASLSNTQNRQSPSPVESTCVGVAPNPAASAAPDASAGAA